jgi:hypothetical protein
MRQLALLCAPLLACHSAPASGPNRLVPGPRAMIDSTYAVTGIEVDIAHLARQLDSLERSDPAAAARYAEAYNRALLAFLRRR